MRFGAGELVPVGPGMQGVMEYRPGARGVVPRKCLEALWVRTGPPPKGVEYRLGSSIIKTASPNSIRTQFNKNIGQDEPERNQEHNHPALAAAPLRLQPATSRP